MSELWCQFEGFSTFPHGRAIATCSHTVGAIHQGVLYMCCTARCVYEAVTRRSVKFLALYYICLQYQWELLLLLDMLLI